MVAGPLTVNLYRAIITTGARWQKTQKRRANTKYFATTAITDGREATEFARTRRRTTIAWDSSKPATSEAKSLFPAQAQANWAALADWLNDLGNFPTTPASFSAGINAWTLIQTQDASASATIDFTTGFSTTYNHYIVKLNNVAPATDGVSLYMRVSQSASFLTGATDYHYSRWGHNSSPSSGVSSDASADFIELAVAVGNAAAYGLGGEVTISAPADSNAKDKMILWNIGWINASAQVNNAIGAGTMQSNANNIDGLRFYMSSGNITIGTFALYGVRKV